MSYKVSEIAKMIHANVLQKGEDVLIENLLTDSRKLLFSNSSLFFALSGIGRSGDSFIKSLYEKGARNFGGSTAKQFQQSGEYLVGLSAAS